MKEIVLRRPRLTSRSVRRGVTLGSAVAIAAVLLGGCVTPVAVDRPGGVDHVVSGRHGRFGQCGVSTS